jgi:hypothetical protein
MHQTVRRRQVDPDARVRGPVQRRRQLPGPIVHDDELQHGPVPGCVVLGNWLDGD